MCCDRLKVYRSEAFCQQIPLNEIFTYKNVPELILEVSNKRDFISKCRTIGAMQSLNGQFYLSDIDYNSPEAPKLLISFTYYKKNVPSCVLPNTVQIFGMLQWQEKPILFVTILQVLIPPMAFRLKRAITGITDHHLAQFDANEPK